HLLLFGIPPSSNGLPEGELAGRFAANTFGKRAYVGPRALKGHGPHRYVFQLFALSCELDPGAVDTLGELHEYAAGNVLACARLDVLFERQ
ncbi:MAG: YbhB/YbcL family Raf kinase inhibitor-like protein, partial [Pseudomonas sp.]